jgi:hypothetical protein
MMIAVLRNKDGLYLKQDGKWTHQFNEARRFDDTPSAVVAKVQCGMGDGELVILMNSEPSLNDVILTLSKGSVLA